MQQRNSSHLIKFVESISAKADVPAIVMHYATALYTVFMFGWFIFSKQYDAIVPTIMLFVFLNLNYWGERKLAVAQARLDFFYEMAKHADIYMGVEDAQKKEA